LTVVCDHLTGKVIWAAKGQFVTCDRAEWIRTVVADRARGATICLDAFHLIGWATDELRRDEWNRLRRDRPPERRRPGSPRGCA